MKIQVTRDIKHLFLNVRVVCVIFAFEISTAEPSAPKYNGGEVNFIYGAQNIKIWHFKNLTATLRLSRTLPQVHCFYLDNFLVAIREILLYAEFSNAVKCSHCFKQHKQNPIQLQCIWAVESLRDRFIKTTENTAWLHNSSCTLGKCVFGVIWGN